VKTKEVAHMQLSLLHALGIMSHRLIEEGLKRERERKEINYYTRE
jgi:hypothetical protein